MGKFKNGDRTQGLPFEAQRILAVVLSLGTGVLPVIVALALTKDPTVLWGFAALAALAIVFFVVEDSARVATDDEADEVEATTGAKENQTSWFFVSSAAVNVILHLAILVVVIIYPDPVVLWSMIASAALTFLNSLSQPRKGWFGELLKEL